jgi:SnoaL-like domain
MGQEDRKAQLKEAATKYFAALANKDFDMIPYEDNVVLRAPLAPGGIHSPLVGRAKLRNIWWPPMPQILGEVKLLDIYYNETLTGVVAEAEVEVTNPKARLRVADRFTVNAAGRIVEQVNHFDPRDVTNPGWQKQSG